MQKKNLHKEKVYKAIKSNYGDSIAFGPFKGMVYVQNSWGRYDLPSKVLGVYEYEVMKKLEKLFCDNINSDFIDIGAADGYYAVGFAYSGLARSVNAFEISSKRRKNLYFNAKNNNCNEKVNIHGKASLESLKKVLKKHDNNTIILIDIEGMEYDLLSEEMLRLIKNCHIIVELHPFLIVEGFKKEKQLLKRANAIFKVSKIYRGTYNPNQFECLNLFSDDERLLSLSEGRGKNPKWILLEPRI